MASHYSARVAALVAEAVTQIGSGGDVAETLERLAESAYAEGGIDISALYRMTVDLSPSAVTRLEIRERVDEARREWDRERKGKVN